MRRRVSNPWPAFTDLFAGLMIVTLGGYLISLGHVEGIEQAEGKAREDLRDLGREVRSKLDRYGVRTDRGVDDAPDSVCIDVYIEFERNRATPRDRERVGRAVQGLCEVLKPGLDEHSDFDLYIEGHTDSTKPGDVPERDRELFNWTLSTARANAVLAQLWSCGIRPPTYNVMAVGYADTRKKCLEDTGPDAEKCHESNRRTTIRLKVNPSRVARGSHALHDGIVFADEELSKSNLPRH